MGISPGFWAECTLWSLTNRIRPRSEGKVPPDLALLVTHQDIDAATESNVLPWKT